VTPVDERYFVAADGAAVERSVQIENPARHVRSAASSSAVLVLVAWLAVLVPIAFGVWLTLQKAVLLFR
jgi:hypothetical protein